MMPERASRMDPAGPAHAECPSCGESLELTVDWSAGRQEYIEDCQVCCKPMQVRIRVSSDGTSSVEVRSEDE